MSALDELLKNMMESPAAQEATSGVNTAVLKDARPPLSPPQGQFEVLKRKFDADFPQATVQQMKNTRTVEPKPVSAKALDFGQEHLPAPSPFSAMPNYMVMTGFCNNCGGGGHWARECPNISVKMIARKVSSCGLCTTLQIQPGNRLCKVARGIHINRWAHERCALTELVSIGAILHADAERAMSCAPRGALGC